MAYYDLYNTYINRHGVFINGIKTEPTKKVMEEYNKRRFWSKVAISQEDLCWEWLAGKCSGGYGTIRFNGKKDSSNRVAYLLHYGIDPKELYVLHTCDNRACCNPKHLFLGTHTDNMQDMAAKGRTGTKVGIESRYAKISEKDVFGILKLKEEGNCYASISRRYSITPEQVSNICRGKSWKHLIK